MQVEVVDSMGAVPAAQWNALDGTSYPFLRHEFLLALEETGCVGGDTGWQPRHLVLRDAQRKLLGAMPLYRKTSSYGEFVFDWAWADAYRRAGLRYFPKFVSAVPFTPATSARLLAAPGADADQVARALIAGAVQLTRDSGASSLHVLFPTSRESELLQSAGMLPRKDCQFHWSNRGYGSFDEFLGEFTAEKRKKARRERRRVAEAGISFQHLAGSEIDADLWRRIMPLYASTFRRRGREPYLNEAFFVQVGRTLPEQVMVILALLRGEPVATAICWRGEDRLYGRYWGSSGDFHSLHFETCYYQGIEYCIEQGLAHFEPGTQGEHKLSRGFVPTETHSAHWLSHPQFSAAVDDYLEREREHIDRYMDVAREHVPFRRQLP